MKTATNYRRERWDWMERFCRKIVVMISVILIGANTAWANPLDGQVVSGSVRFDTQGNTLNITNSPNSIINWRSFSISANETTRFIQQNSASSVLNRIYGQDPSQILGTLQSNGRVLLINPNGIIFGKASRVDVNGLIASTLNLSDQDFLTRKYKFSAGVTVGTIQNQGTIVTPSGGVVYLIAPDIENSGIIHTPQGDVMLAAGHSVELFDSFDPDISVVVSAPTDKVVNLGQIIADSGEIGIYGGLISQKGTINADKAVVGENGKIFFKATQDITLDAASTTSAKGDQGGQIKVQSASGTTLVSGTVSATGNSEKGGKIEILGNHVGLMDNARVDASGKTGGGEVLIGGDYQGKNPDVQNAAATYVGQNAIINADATDHGDGGKVIIWAENATRAYGSIFARGGENGGNGGFVETSGGYLDVNGINVATMAPLGANGTWLLDPSDILITSTGSGSLTGPPWFYDPTGATGTISWGTIEGGLAGGNVTIQTTSGSGGNGDITAEDGYNFINAGAGVLTMIADRDITFNTLGIPLSGNPLGLTLQAGRNVVINNELSLDSPSPVNITAVGNIVVNDLINAFTIGASGANISMTSTGGITGNTANLTATTGSISMNNAAFPTQINTLNLNAVTGIYGSTPTDPFRTGGSPSIIINASNSGAGPILINDVSSNGLTVGSPGINQSGAGQPISLYTNPVSIGGMTVNGPIINNSGDILLTVGKQDYLLTLNNTVTATGGNVTYVADNISVNAMTTSSTSAGANIHVYPFTGTTNIEFSPNADAAGYLRLSSAEMEYFTTPMLKVGQNIVTGNISIMEPVAPTYPYYLSLITSGAILQTAGSTLTVANLNADGWTGVTLNEANDVDNLGGHSDTGSFSFTDLNGINVGFVDVNNGINISTGGNIILSSGANVTQSGGAVLLTPPTGNLTVNASTGINLTEANIIPNVNLNNATSGDIIYDTNVPALFVEATNAAAGNIDIANNSGSLIVNNAATGSGNITLYGSGNVNLAGTVLSSGNINVATGASFINSFGAGVFPGSGNWLVWSGNPASDTRGGLVYDFKQYAATYGTTTPSGTGNGFLYNIAPALTAGLTGSVAKTYDATTNAILAVGNYVVSGAIDGDTITLNNPVGAYDNKNVGTGKTVTVNGLTTTATNGVATVYGYTVNSNANAAIGSITPATLTTSGAAAQDKIYDATTAATITGETLAGVLGSDVVNVSGDGTFADANAGAAKPVTAALILTGTDSGNYILTQPTGLTANITPAALTITANNDAKTYDGLAYNGGNGVVYSGFIGSETPTVLGGTLTYSGTSQGAFNAGGYVIVPEGLTSGNYTINYNDGVLVVNPAFLSITADDQTKYAGEPNPVFTATYSGFVPGENPSVLNGTLMLTTSAGNLSPAGDYPIIPSGVTSNNYQISFLNGNLRVDPVMNPLAIPQANVLYVSMLNSDDTISSTFTVVGSGCGGSSDSDTNDDSQLQKDGQGGGNKDQALPYCN